MNYLLEANIFPSRTDFLQVDIVSKAFTVYNSPFTRNTGDKGNIFPYLLYTLHLITYYPDNKVESDLIGNHIYIYTISSYFYNSMFIVPFRQLFIRASHREIVGVYISRTIKVLKSPDCQKINTYYLLETVI